MTDHHHTTVDRPVESTKSARRVTARHISLLAALEGAVILLWALWRLLGVGLEVTAGTGTREVGLVAIVLTTTLVTVASYVLLWALRRRELRVWTGIAVTVLLLSCAGPLLSATTVGSTVALLTFHLLVGIGLVAGVRRLDHTDR